jgi:hypothetical protein
MCCFAIGIRSAYLAFPKLRTNMTTMLMNENATAEDIAGYLFKIATEDMALSDRKMARLCDGAAEAVVALRSNF